MSDPYNLTRFVDAQERTFERACAELQAGRKSGHWMWFVFPQIEGLGHSETARRFAISCRAEAEAYLKHPLLGARLRECVRLVNGVSGRSAHEVFGHPDDLKFHSSMTLFADVAADDAVFEEALRKYFAGQRDQLTIEKLRP
ncbi:MAG: DUF1810 domain-containing protein [Roseiarcus sp.]|jgi:uncharacterized protein (DUF1810 family)